MCSRCAIHFNVMMLSRLSRNAIFTFSGSPLRRFTRSVSSHFRRFSSAVTIRSAFSSPDSCRSAP